MAIYQKFNAFSADKHNGVHNLGADELKLMLTNVAPDPDADSVYTDITEIADGNGYTLGGKVLGIDSSAQVGGVYDLAPTADVVWTAAGGAIATFRYVVLYNNTAASKNLISFYDRGSAVNLADTDKFTADVGPSIITEE